MFWHLKHSNFPGFQLWTVPVLKFHQTDPRGLCRALQALKHCSEILTGKSWTENCFAAVCRVIFVLTLAVGGLFSQRGPVLDTQVIPTGISRALSWLQFPKSKARRAARRKTRRACRACPGALTSCKTQVLTEEMMSCQKASEVNGCHKEHFYLREVGVWGRCLLWVVAFCMISLHSAVPVFLSLELM